MLLNPFKIVLYLVTYGRFASYVHSLAFHSLDRVAAARRRRAGSGEARREETPPVPFLSPSVHVVATLLLLRPKASGERSETDGTRRMEREPSGRPFGASLVSHVPTVVRLSLRACGTPEGTEEE